MFFKIFFAVSLCISTAASRKNDNFYRRDYTYFEEYDAFYKFHWGESESTWQESYLTCEDEGAQLLYPADENERRVAANLSASVVDLEYIYVGVRDEFGLGDFITTDGRFVPELSDQIDNTSNIQAISRCGVLSTKTGTIITHSCELRIPFICKKLNNEFCPTSDSGYIFSKYLKKCFKFNDNKKTWANALHTCIMEGGVLSDSILNTDIRNLNMPMRQDISYYIGFRRMEKDNFYSNRGLKTTISVNYNYENYYCTVISINNGVHTVDCEETRPFICEMEVNK